MAPSDLVAEWQAARQALITSERSLRRDAQRPPLSSAEQKAEKIIRAIRKKEAEGIWAAPHEAIPHPFPGMEFLTGIYTFCVVIERVTSPIFRKEDY